MNKKDTVYIFGHRNPDTDSVTSAIALSYLKKKQGLDCEPAVLSSLNLETSYVLNYFKVPEPIFLNDVKIKFIDSRKNEIDSSLNYDIYIYKYNKPKYHINCDEFYNYIKTQKIINI